MQHSKSEIITDYRVLNDAQSSVIRALLYFDLFKYPLTADEIRIFSDNENAEDLTDIIRSLKEIDLIASHEEMYFLSDKQEHVNHRKAVNRRAKDYYRIANRYTKLISGFPFVKGVLITGSLSKRCMDIDGDIDYLIITKPGRLWLCRIFLTVYKKVFLLDSRKYFCVNYYIDEDSLLIPDRNLFTATEINSAQPGYNKEVCERFFQSNNWTKKFYPNFSKENTFEIHENTSSFFKTISEKLFAGKAGDIADEWMMRLFVRRWKSKFKGEDKGRFEINFRSRKNVSKHHPHGFQFKILNAYEQNLKNFERKFNVKLT